MQWYDREGSMDPAEKRKIYIRYTTHVHMYALSYSCVFFLDITKLYLHLRVTVYLVAAGFFLQKRVEELGPRGKVRQEIQRGQKSRGSGRDRRVVVPEDGKRRKREAPNTQHNPAASSASMDFKRSPRLLLFPFLSFSFFYYYFRGADGCALAPAHGVCVRHVCTCTRVCIRVCIRIHSSQVELDLGWVGCVETMDDFG